MNARNKTTRAMFLFTGIVLILFSASAWAIDAGQAARNVTGVTQDILDLIIIVFFIVGTLLVGMGLNGFRRNSQTQGQSGIALPIISVITGGLLLALGFVVQIPGDTVFGSGSTRSGSLTIPR